MALLFSLIIIQKVCSSRTTKQEGRFIFSSLVLQISIWDQIFSRKTTVEDNQEIKGHKSILKKFCPFWKKKITYANKTRLAKRKLEIKEVRKDMQITKSKKHDETCFEIAKNAPITSHSKEKSPYLLFELKIIMC